jgi:hypothetical protein
MYVGGILACNIVCVTLLYVLRCTFFIRSESISYVLYVRYSYMIGRGRVLGAVRQRRLCARQAAACAG